MKRTEKINHILAFNQLSKALKILLDLFYSYLSLLF